MLDFLRPASAMVLALVLAGCASAGGSAASPVMASPDVAAASPPPPPPSTSVVASDVDYEARLQFLDTPIAGGSVAPPTHAKQPPHAPGLPHAPVPAKPVLSAPAAPTEAPPTTATPAPPPRRESLLIYTATLVLAVFQVDASLTKIEELSRSVGGYLASRNDTSIVIRVPRARFQEALGEVAKIGDVLHRNVEAQDVSDQVVDLEARLKNARAVRDRIAQLLQGATATKDALEIEKELARVMGEIELMEGKLQLFADKIAYSTVTVNFQALHTSEVHAMARLPFPWLQELGLSTLLQVR